MSRPSWDPFPHTTSTSGHATTATNTSITPISISTPSPISSEDARLLDPSYLSSFPLTNSGVHHGYFGFGSGMGGGGSGAAAAAAATGLHMHTHAMPYIDAQGTLHDPDYRPFPIIQSTNRAPSPFAMRKQYWGTDDEWETEGEQHNGDDGDDNGSTPNTPTSTTPFICYFLETHPLKRNPASPRNGSSRHLGSSKDSNGRGRGRRGKNTGARCQLKLGSAYMYATVATSFGSRSQSLANSPVTPTVSSATSPINHTATAMAANLSTVENESNEKERRGWGGILWRTGKKEGGEKD